MDTKPAVVKQILTKLINEALKHKQNIDKLTTCSATHTPKKSQETDKARRKHLKMK